MLEQLKLDYVVRFRQCTHVMDETKKSTGEWMSGSSRAVRLVGARVAQAGTLLEANVW